MTDVCPFPGRGLRRGPGPASSSASPLASTADNLLKKVSETAFKIKSASALRLPAGPAAAATEDLLEV